MPIARSPGRRPCRSAGDHRRLQDASVAASIAGFRPKPKPASSARVRPSSPGQIQPPAEQAADAATTARPASTKSSHGRQAVVPRQEVERRADLALARALGEGWRDRRLAAARRTRNAARPARWSIGFEQPARQTAIEPATTPPSSQHDDPGPRRPFAPRQGVEPDAPSRVNPKATQSASRRLSVTSRTGRARSRLSTGGSRKAPMAPDSGETCQEATSAARAAARERPAGASQTSVASPA